MVADLFNVPKENDEEYLKKLTKYLLYTQWMDDEFDKLKTSYKRESKILEKILIKSLQKPVKGPKVFKSEDQTNLLASTNFVSLVDRPLLTQQIPEKNINYLWNFVADNGVNLIICLKENTTKFWPDKCKPIRVNYVLNRMKVILRSQLNNKEGNFKEINVYLEKIKNAGCLEVKIIEACGSWLGRKTKDFLNKTYEMVKTSRDNNGSILVLGS